METRRRRCGNEADVCDNSPFLLLQHAKPFGYTHQVGNGQVRKRVDASLLLHRPDSNPVTQHLSVPMRSNAE
jgi:hypothetical protein